jgi:hypothetical protein
MILTVFVLLLFCINAGRWLLDGFPDLRSLLSMVHMDLCFTLAIHTGAHR